MAERTKNAYLPLSKCVQSVAPPREPLILLDVGRIEIQVKAVARYKIVCYTHADFDAQLRLRPQLP